MQTNALVNELATVQSQFRNKELTKLCDLGALVGGAL